MLSPDGRCKAFDARGTASCAAKVGMVVLKRLATPRPTVTVYALVRGTAVNQDGRSGGLLWRRAGRAGSSDPRGLRTAGSLRSGPYVEAHGTGTPSAIRSR